MKIKQTTFAVYRDETKIIAHSQDVNQLTLEDNENNLYRIENADDTVTSLKAGDIFSVYEGRWKCFDRKDRTDYRGWNNSKHHRNEDIHRRDL